MTVLYIISHKLHVSTLYNSVNSKAILHCNMSNSRLKYPQLEIDKIKPVSEMNSSYEFQKLSHFEEEGMEGGRLVFTCLTI